MIARDPELVALLIAELDRHGALVARGHEDAASAARALQALRGSASLAGERELASAITRVERRLRGGDLGAVTDACALVRTASVRLSSGQSATVAVWPEPPTDLAPCATEPGMRALYLAELTDRVARIDDALGSSAESLESVEYIYRQLHTIKGAAGAVGDEPMSWFCHGLEELLRAGAATGDDATAVLRDLPRWRSVLGRLLIDSEDGLRLLRSITGTTREHAASGGLASLAREQPSETSYRVSAASVDRLFDRVASVTATTQRQRSRTAQDRRLSTELGALRNDLNTALRLIGPARPWGAPAAALDRVRSTAAALSRIAGEVDLAALGARTAELQSSDTLTAAKAELASMRQTPIAPLLSRIAMAITAEARRSGREVAVVIEGGEVTVDRVIADQLADPCLQLARNAVAHGIEAPATRAAAGKPAQGTICISAHSSSTRLQVTVADDGAGVDVAKIRRRAVETGAVTPLIADASDDDTLLALLFLPGFSTRESTDWLAGRGIGLDIALAAVQRLSGTIRLSSQLGVGLTARVEVPVETGVTRVVWARAGAEDYALVASQIARASAIDPRAHDQVPHLATCLGGASATPGAVSIELRVDDAASESVRVAVDRIGEAEDLLIRPISLLIASMGPFAGAVVTGSGAVHLVVDTSGLAPRVRALANVSRPDALAAPGRANRL